ncbi:VWA domain-containing protein, partial [Myxococcota bacterium]|nr:VWA domain-containing protein [Myxococcota bacterium]
MGMSGIGIGGGGGITMGSRGAVGGRAYGMAASPSPRRMVGPGMAPPRSDFDAKRDNENFNTESYAGITENAFLRVGSSPLSTFSIDVDTASYANMRRMILGGSKPLADAIRIEELVNYFTYGYKGPDTAAQPFAVHTEVTSAPWAPDHLLARVGIQGRTLEIAERKASNLVFLLDVSGSMSSWNKLPMLSRALRMLVEKLDTTDRVAIVVYAGAEGVALPSTSCKNKTAILNVLDQLQSGGSTNAGAGIQLAYKIALENFIPVGVNRVILATDGDFNVGLTSEGELLKVVEGFARKNVFLTILGFGMGNYKDSMLETLSNKGNGNYAYIDSLLEAEKVLVKQMGGTLVTIAKDVKLQVEFNPKHVGAYRLIGYENRIMAAQDFNDDTKDAGEIGAGHTVTALYEIIP